MTKHMTECPRCKGGVFYAIETVQSPDYQYGNSMRPLSIAGYYGETEESGLFGPKKGRMIVELKARVCKGCGYTELYAKDLDVLERMAQSGEGGVRIIE